MNSISTNSLQLTGRGWDAPRLSWTVLLLAVLVYLMNTYRFHLERWDDAFITFRFAEHVASGRGLIWNIGGAPVEGYTSLLHVLLLAYGIKLDIDPVQGSLALSLLAVLLTLAMLIFIVRRHLGGLHPLTAAVIGIYLVDPTTAIHTTSGLETQVFIASLCAGYLTALAYIDRPRWGTAALLALMVFLSLLSRPEGILYGAALYVALGVFGLRAEDGRGGKQKILSQLAVSGAVVVLLLLFYVLWKYWYFGYLLPNPYYVKSGRVSLAGVGHVGLFATHVGAWLCAPLLFGLLSLVLMRSREAVISLKSLVTGPLLFRPSRSAQAKVLATLLPPLLALAYYLTIIHEVGGAYRFSFPTYFYLVLGAAILLTLSLRSVPISRRHWIMLVGGIAAWPLMLITVQGGWRGAPLPLSDFYQYHFRIACALKETGLESSGTIVCDAAGVIPYVSNYNQVDRVGLTDNYLSGRQAATPEQREAYLWSRQADVYVGYEPPAQAGARGPSEDPRMATPYVSQILLARKLTGIEERIFVQRPELLHARMRELRDNWHWVGELEWPGWGLWKLKSFVYVRKNSPHAETLIRSLKTIIALDPQRIDLEKIK